jgi:hypothetical protein
MLSTNRLTYIFFFFLILFSKIAYTDEYELSIVAIFQNEAAYLKEWIDFHLKMGVQHFYLYNHQSTDNFSKVLKSYIKSKKVTLVDWDYSIENIYQWNDIQCSAYNHALNNNRNNVWMIFIDTDEFIFPVQEKNLVNFLKDYLGCPAVCANWQMYGTSHVAKIQSGQSMLKLLTHKAKTDSCHNHHVKSIVQPKYVKNFNNPHYANFIDSRHHQVTENKFPFSGPSSPFVSINKIRINHYWTRDEHFMMNNKIPRRKKWGGEASNVLLLADILNDEYDPILANSGS